MFLEVLDDYLRQRECWDMFAVREEDIAIALRDDYRKRYEDVLPYPGKASFSGGLVSLQKNHAPVEHGEAVLPNPSMAASRKKYGEIIKRSAWERQRIEAARIMRKDLELTAHEVECWRMFGIQCEWFMDELTIKLDTGDKFWGFDPGSPKGDFYSVERYCK